MQATESALPALRQSSAAEAERLKEKCKGHKTDAARLEAERDGLKVQLKGKADMVAAAGFKAKVGSTGARVE